MAFCDNCAGDPKFVCGNCNDAYYCNAKCQENHWNKDHSDICIGKRLDKKMAITLKNVKNDLKYSEEIRFLYYEGVWAKCAEGDPMSKRKCQPEEEITITLANGEKKKLTESDFKSFYDININIIKISKIIPSVQYNYYYTCIPPKPEIHYGITKCDFYIYINMIRNKEPPEEYFKKNEKAIVSFVKSKIEQHIKRKIKI
jgi:hypothetical protein